MSNDATKNLGELGLLTTVSAGVVSIAGLATPFTQSGTGAVARTTQDKLRESVSVLDFGADPTGVVECHSLIQSAISSFGSGVSGVINFPSTGTFKINAPILIPTNIILNGNGCKLIGTGTRATDAFHTGYYVGATLTDLVGLPNATAYILGASISGFTFTNFNICLNLQGLNQGSEVTNCSATYCNQMLVDNDSYYPYLAGLYCSYIGVGTGLPAFEFMPYSGQVDFGGLSVNHSDLAYLFYNSVQCTDIHLLDAENCITAIKFQNPIYNPDIRNCYFEAISGVCIDFGSLSCSVTGGQIHNNWVNTVGTFVNFNSANATSTKIYDNAYSGVIGTRVNLGTSGPSVGVKIDDGTAIYDNIAGTFPIQGTANGAAYSQYSTNSATPWSNFYKLLSNYSSSSGNLQAKALDYMGTTTPFNYYGSAGTPDTNQIPFCKAVATAIIGSNFNIQITTCITYSPYTFGVFALTLQDGVSAYVIKGRFVGPDGYLDTSAGKTLSVTSVSGVFVLTFSGFSNDGAGFLATGVVKMI